MMYETCTYNYFVMMWCIIVMLYSDAVLYIMNALNVTISTNLMMIECNESVMNICNILFFLMLWYMMNKCFVLMYWNYGAHVLYINDVNVELCMTIYVLWLLRIFVLRIMFTSILLIWQIVLRVRDPDVQRW